MAFYSSLYDSANSAFCAQSYQATGVSEYSGGDLSCILAPLLLVFPDADRYITFVNYFPRVSDGEVREIARALTEKLLIGSYLNREKREIWLIVRSVLSGEGDEAIRQVKRLRALPFSTYTSACVQVLQWLLTGVTDQGIHEYLEDQTDPTVLYLVLEFASARAICMGNLGTASDYLLKILENIPEEMVLEQIYARIAYQYCCPEDNREAVDTAIRTAEKQGMVVPVGWLDFVLKNSLFCL